MVFLVKSSEDVPGCPRCQGQLRYRDSRTRICRHEGGVKDILRIRRFRCTRCNSYHNELPDMLLPYKHYEAEIIGGVIDGIVTPEDQDSADYPSLGTMLCWLRWFRRNLENMEKILRGIGSGPLAPGEDFLFSDQSLLRMVRTRRADWLERIMRIIYNSGGFLPALSR